MRIEEEAYRPDKRAEFANNVVMLTSNQRHDFPFEPMMLALGTGLYKEQVRWREAATGRLIAESDFFEPMSPNTAVTPGVRGDPDDRRELIGKNRPQRRQIARAVAFHAKELADRRLALCHAVEVAHAQRTMQQLARRTKGEPDAVLATPPAREN